MAAAFDVPTLLEVLYNSTVSCYPQVLEHTYFNRYLGYFGVGLKLEFLTAYSKENRILSTSHLDFENKISCKIKLFHLNLQS